jgi:hypothetical protein
MQVLADVDEADVGQLSPDSKVSFTVGAFPTETFEGTIDQIRRPARDVNGRIQIDAPLFLNANRSSVCRCVPEAGPNLAEETLLPVCPLLVPRNGYGDTGLAGYRSHRDAHWYVPGTRTGGNPHIDLHHYCHRTEYTSRIDNFRLLAINHRLHAESWPRQRRRSCFAVHTGGRGQPFTGGEQRDDAPRGRSASAVLNVPLSLSAATCPFPPASEVNRAGESAAT